MASPFTSYKSSCSTCAKAAGIFTCRGCAKDFCTQHVAEHRRTLNKQMDDVVVCRDQLHQGLGEEITENQCKILMEQIDRWEQQSITTIHQIANDTRKQLTNVIGKYTTKLNNITEQLNKARIDDDFNEMDLRRWTQKLEKLTSDLTTPRTIKVRQDDKPIKDIKSVFVSEMASDCFLESIGNIQIEDRSQLIVHGILPMAGLVRGKKKYSSGYHQIRFRLECSDNKTIFFGIVSKSVPLKSQSYKTSTVYGWAGVNNVVLNGVEHSQFHSYKLAMEENDIIELLIACDQQMIRLTNEQTKVAYEIDVDLTKCPFPWQINLCLSWWTDRVRILMP